ncbi:Hcn4 [Symbiodinium pilosum]|uniref:Hcn4 protein n=1 Tax=Symbiodinium pilosum TaxID=2952 RepID=A0A812VLL8_SYMPI|nr:Hcn4 [Symbiodinium pilosum]
MAKAEDLNADDAEAPFPSENIVKVPLGAFKNPKFQQLVEVYSRDLKQLVQENLRLRVELGLDQDAPLDWDSDEDSDPWEDHPLRQVVSALSSPAGIVTRTRSEPPPSVAETSQAELESRKSSSFQAERYQVLPQFLSTPLDKATDRQFKATLVQDLRRFSEAVEMRTLGNDNEKKMSCYDLFVNLLSQLKLPMSPNSEIALTWDIIGLFLIAYDVFAIPLQAFPLGEDVFTESMGWITLCFWTADMVVSNIVGFFDGPQLVMQQYRITFRYLRTWFVLDAVVVIPDWLTRLAQDSSSGLLASVGRILRSARAIRVIRLLRLLKLQKMMNKLYDFIDSEYLFIVMDILRLLLFIVVLNHVIACLWYLLGYIGHEANEKNANEKNGSRTPNWLEDTGYTKVIDGSIAWQYTTALHWSLTQFTPAGMDVFARNVPERVMSVIVLGFAVIIFSSVLASVSASMTALRSLQGDSKKQFWLLRRYLRRKKVTTPSRVRIIKFLEHVVMLQAKTVKSADVTLLGKLSEPLKELLEYEVHKETVMLHPFFHYLGECVLSLMVKLCAAAVRQVQFALQDCIFRAGDLGEHMFFITSGSAKYAYSIAKAQKCEELHEGDWLAEASLWTQWSHRGLLMISSQPTVLLLLSSQGFGNVMRMSQSSYVLCRRFVFAFVAELNAMERFSTAVM